MGAGVQGLALESASTIYSGAISDQAIAGYSTLPDIQPPQGPGNLHCAGDIGAVAKLAETGAIDATSKLVADCFP